MIEYNQIAQKAVVFQKNAFESAYDAVAKVQDQAATVMDKLMDQSKLVPDAGRQAIKNWVNACQEERDRFKSYVEGSFSGLEKCFTLEGKTALNAIAEPKN